MAPRLSSSKSIYLRLFFLLGAIEGAATFIYLLILPTDPGGILFGYSAARLAMLTTALIGGLAFAALTVRLPIHLATRLVDFIIDHRQLIPNLLFGLLSASLILGGWLLIFHTQTILKLNEAYLSRLAPFFIWAFLLVIQAAVLWEWRRHKPRIKLPSYGLDAILLLVIWLISLVSRTLLTGYGLPYQSVWDEPVTYPQALNMLTTPGLRPFAEVPGYGRTSYGDLPVYITAAVEVLGLMEGLRSQEVESAQAYVSPPRGVATIYQAVHESGIPLRYPRLAFALINSLLPVLIYLILRRFFAVDPWSACGAALLLAFFSRDVLYYSSYILPDAFATTLFVCLLIAAWRAMDSPAERWQPWLISGILGGIIVSVNIRLVIVISIPFLALLLARFSTNMIGMQDTSARDKNILKGEPLQASRICFNAVITNFAAILVGLVLGFVLTSPYAVLDLPNFIAKWTAFSWYHELGWTHRFDSIAFYLKGMFMPGFGDVYIDSSEGSIGFGIPAGLLAALGFAGLIKREPRRTILMLFFGVLQLYLISPIVQRYTRHALVLYPLIAIAAGMGLSMIVRALHQAWLRQSLYKGNYWRTIQKAIPTFVLMIFLLVYAGQIHLVVRYIERNVAYQPSQVRATDYLVATLKPGEMIGILDILPWVETDLDQRGIKFVRVGLNDKIEQWQSLGLAYVVGTDRLQGDFGSADGTVWAQSAGLIRIAEFGGAYMNFAGYPSNELYIYIARVPSVPAGGDSALGGSP
jgi:hypothetical protein